MRYRRWCIINLSVFHFTVTFVDGMKEYYFQSAFVLGFINGLRHHLANNQPILIPKTHNSGALLPCDTCTQGTF